MFYHAKYARVALENCTRWKVHTTSRKVTFPRMSLGTAWESTS